jgi:hypothetical protein
MNDLRKIPDGHRDASSRSRSSNSETEIFVFSAIDERAIFLRSRSRRRRRPKL